MSKKKLHRFVELDVATDVLQLIKEVNSFSLAEVIIEGRESWGILLDGILLAQIDDEVEATNTFNLLSQSVYLVQALGGVDQEVLETTNVFGFNSEKFEA